MKQEVIKRNLEIKKYYEFGYSTKVISEMFNMSQRMIQILAKENGWSRLDKKTIKQSIGVIKDENTKGKLLGKREPIFIYLIIFDDVRVYIGRTNNILHRMRVHINMCKNGIHNSRYIQKKFNEDSEAVLCKFKSPKILYTNIEGGRELAIIKEKEYIQKYIDNGYIVLGGKY